MLSYQTLRRARSTVLANPPVLDHAVHVFVAAAAEVHQHGAGAHLAGSDQGMRHGVRALERGDDALLAAEREERVAAFVVARRDVTENSRTFANVASAWL